MQLAFWHFKLIVKLSDLQIRQQLEQLHALMQETEHRYASSFTTVHPSQLECPELAGISFVTKHGYPAAPVWVA
jgi:hypothetical protein